MVKYFAAVRQCPSYGLVVLGVVLVIGVLTIQLNPAELDSALGLVLIAQMFLASTGFATTARRGHFDPLLVHGSDRRAVLTAQWCASIAPGALAWATLTACGYLMASPIAWSALVGSRLVAFAIVSAVGWVVGFWLPRGAGGAMWMGVLIVLLLRHPDLAASADSANSAIGIARTAGALVLCPFLLLGSHVQVSVWSLLASCSAAAALLLTTIRVGSRLDVYLVERS